MAIPNGYTRIEANKLYENVEYYIDTSVRPTEVNNLTAPVPYIVTTQNSSGEDNLLSIGLEEGLTMYDYSNNVLTFANTTFGEWYNVIVDGVITGYPTLNINLTTSPDWLYVKGNDKKLVPLYEGDEIQDEIVGADVTSNGTYEYTPETGFVATKKVSLKVAVPQLDTSDATATSSDMLSGKTAYVNGLKVTGNIQTYTPSQEVVENGTLAIKNKYVNNNIVVNVQPTLRENYEFVANGEYPVPEGFDGYGTVNVNVPNVNPYTASSESEFNTYLAEENVGSVVKYTGETTETLKKDRLYLIKQVEGVEISFTIDGTEYKALDGMTWGEWCDSEYNTNWWYVEGENIVKDTASYKYFILGVTPTDIIEATRYITEVLGGGGGAGN